jgi:hypothetical protein
MLLSIQLSKLLPTILGGGYAEFVKLLKLEKLGIFCLAVALCLIKSLEPYSSTKGTLREEVCSRLIKPTTQVYLGNVGLLTRPLTCGTIVQTRVQREGRPNIVQGPEALIPY